VDDGLNIEQILEFPIQSVSHIKAKQTGVKMTKISPLMPCLSYRSFLSSAASYLRLNSVTTWNILLGVFYNHWFVNA